MDKAVFQFWKFEPKGVGMYNVKNVYPLDHVYLALHKKSTLLMRRSGADNSSANREVGGSSLAVSTDDPLG